MTPSFRIYALILQAIGCGCAVDLDLRSPLPDAGRGGEPESVVLSPATPYVGRLTDTGLDGIAFDPACSEDECVLAFGTRDDVTGAVRYARPGGERLDADPIPVPPGIFPWYDCELPSGIWRLGEPLDVALSSGRCIVAIREPFGLRLQVARLDDSGEVIVLWRSALLERKPDNAWIIDGEPRLVLWTYRDEEPGESTVVIANVQDEESTGQVVGVVPGTVASVALTRPILLAWHTFSSFGLSALSPAAPNLREQWSRETPRHAFPRIHPFPGGAYVSWRGGLPSMSVIRVDENGVPVADEAIAGVGSAWPATTVMMPIGSTRLIGFVPVSSIDSGERVSPTHIHQQLVLYR